MLIAMASDCFFPSSSPCIQSTMDGLWFHHNILSSTFLGLNTNSTTSSQSSINSSSYDECASNQSTQSLQDNQQISIAKSDISIKQCSFDDQTLPQPWSAASTSSCPSLPTIDNSDLDLKSRRKNKRSQKAKKKIDPMVMTRRVRSMVELENYELKGFEDLGFVFHKEELSPEIINLVPGLQRLHTNKKKEKESFNNGGEDANVCCRRYLSEAWFSPLLDVQRLPGFTKGDMFKKRLRQWAKTVASVASQ